jgi:plastocyanin
VRFLAVAVIAAAGALTACGEDASEQNSPMPPTTTLWMQDNRFDPQGATVEVGVKLTWLNKDDARHDVDFVSGGTFQSEPVAKGGTIEFTPRKAGTINYVCSVHPSMTGVLVVE